MFLLKMRLKIGDIMVCCFELNDKKLSLSFGLLYVQENVGENYRYHFRAKWDEQLQNCHLPFKSFYDLNDGKASTH